MAETGTGTGTGTGDRRRRQYLRTDLGTMLLMENRSQRQRQGWAETVATEAETGADQRAGRDRSGRQGRTRTQSEVLSWK
jgi:hypothetical protein